MNFELKIPPHCHSRREPAAVVCEPNDTVLNNIFPLAGPFIASSFKGCLKHKLMGDWFLGMQGILMSIYHRNESADSRRVGFLIDDSNLTGTGEKAEPHKPLHRPTNLSYNPRNVKPTLTRTSTTLHTVTGSLRLFFSRFNITINVFPIPNRCTASSTIWKRSVTVPTQSASKFSIGHLEI